MEKVLKINEILSQHFTKIPGFFQRKIINWFHKIPMTELVFNINDDIVNNQKEVASEKLFQNMNLFITENIFKKLSTRWVLPVFVLNIAIQVFIIITKL